MKILHGDCLEHLKDLPDNSVDSIVTDPPYGISFMGKKWDYDVPSEEVWKECLRVLKPGGHLLAFAGTRTQHRMAVRIEDAGFEIRDMIMYVYGSGFPKSLNIYKQFQKMCTCGNMVEHEKETISGKQATKHSLRPLSEADIPPTQSSYQKQDEGVQPFVQQQTEGTPVSVHTRSDSEASYEGGKEPSLERRSDIQTPEGELQGSEVCPLSASVPSDGEEGRVRDGAQVGSGSTPEHDTQTGTGSASHRPQPIEQFTGEPCAFCKQWGAQEVRRRASEIYGFGSALKPACEPITVARKPLSEKNLAENVLTHGTGGINIDGCRVEASDQAALTASREQFAQSDIHTKSNNDARFLASKKIIPNMTPGRFPANLIHDGSDEVVGLFPEARSNGNKTNDKSGHQDAYVGGELMNKVSSSCYSDKGSAARFFYCAKASKKDRNSGGVNSNHPTVKPTDLMRYLCRLVTPPGGTVLDPFMGSGSTGKAAKLEGFDFIGIEREAEYVEIAKARINAVDNPVD